MKKKEKKKKKNIKTTPAFQRQGKQKAIDTIFGCKEPCDN